MKIAEVFDDFYRELPNTRGNWAPYIVRHLKTPEGEEFGVYKQGHKIGYARLSRDRSYITDVSVLPEHRRRGIAKALYSHIEQQLGYPLKPSPLHQTGLGTALWQGRQQPQDFVESAPPGQIDEYPIRVIADDSQEIAPSSAAEFQRRTGEILVRDRYKNNQPLLYHEIGHALFDHIQNITAADMFQQDPPAWQEFLTTSTARSYQQRLGLTDDATRSNPTSYDWVEALADLYMEYRLGRFQHLPHLSNFIAAKLLNRQSV